MTLASLDDPASLRPVFHLWVSEKLPWIQIEDGLIRFPEWPGRAP